MVKKIHNNPDNKVTLSIRVSDEWYPTFEDGTVRVSAMILLDGLTVRICAWGADDFGLEKDTKTSSGGEARRLFREAVDYINNLKALEPIDKDFLWSEGFVMA